MDPNAVLARLAAERFLYRLSRSRHADPFVQKGALLMLVWLGDSIRPTRDADLLGFGDLSRESLARILVDVRNTEVEPDGVTRDALRRYATTNGVDVKDKVMEDVIGALKAKRLVEGPFRTFLDTLSCCGATSQPAVPKELQQTAKNGLICAGCSGGVNQDYAVC